MKYLLTSLLLFSSLLIHGAFAQPTVDQNKIDASLEKRGNQFLKNKNVTSVSLAVVTGGKSYTAHFGELTKGQGNTPNDETIYEVGSVTKTITGQLVAKAVMDGKLTVDDDIQFYLGKGFQNLSYDGKPILIRHLLTHTAGLPTFLPVEIGEAFTVMDQKVPTRFNQAELKYNKDDFFDALATVELTAAPGSAYNYSNAGAELMGYLLEQVYEQPIDSLFDKLIRDNYSMQQTTLSVDPARNEYTSTGYWMSNESTSPLMQNPLWGTSGTAKMSVKDIVTYMSTQLENNNPMVTAAQEVLYEVDAASQVAFFWWVQNDKYGTSYNHHGGTTGTQNWLFVFPKYDLGITIITNQSDQKTPELLSKTVKRILKDILKV